MIILAMSILIASHAMTIIGTTVDGTIIVIGITMMVTGIPIMVIGITILGMDGRWMDPHSVRRVHHRMKENR
jgi:hypothetical protein